MWEMFRSKTEVEVIGEELGRLHALLFSLKSVFCVVDVLEMTPDQIGVLDENSKAIWGQIIKLENTLNEIARKRAGLEY